MILVEPGQLERLAVDMLQFRQGQPKVKLAGCDPVRLPVDDDEVGVAAAGGFRPPDFQAPLWSLWGKATLAMTLLPELASTCVKATFLDWNAGREFGVAGVLVRIPRSQATT